jgi:glucan phosphoethanolaminetransferase (alkaline phosphatase superfamily)
MINRNSGKTITRLISMQKEYWNNNKLFYFFVVATTFYFSIAISPADFLKNPISNSKDVFIILSHWLVVLLATLGFIHLISINKYVFAVAFPVFILLNSVLAFFRFTANISLTPMLVDASLHNDLRSSLDLVSLKLILFVLLNLVISSGILYIRLKRIKFTFPLFHLAQSLIIILLFTTGIGAFIRPISERLPYITYFATSKYLKEKEIIREIRPSISDDARTTEDSLIVVLVIGEALRSDHLSLNGYVRETTPMLKRAGVISLPNVYSEYTYTDASLPYMLTRADSAHPGRAYAEPSFIGFFNKCGYQTTWIANQEPANSYFFFTYECKDVIYANMGKNNYNFDSWLDETMLPYFDATIKKTNPRQLIILHTIGSHWWYNSHFTEEFARFKPVIHSRVISSCSTEEMINSYDNTVLYTDYFVSEIIGRLKEKNAILIYQSDHGELLGEDGKWLHASEGLPLHQPAAFVWMSEKYKRKNLDKFEVLKEKSSKRFRTDYLFNTILDAANIQSGKIVQERSIFMR